MLHFFASSLSFALFIAISISLTPLRVFSYFLLLIHNVPGFMVFMFSLHFFFPFMLLQKKDFISLDDEDDASPQKRDRESDCVCLKKGTSDSSSSCICCLDFNISDTFDLGQACARIRYISQSEGVSMNLTIGKTFSKTSTIKIEKPGEPVCLSMLGGIAKMCAKFNGLVRSANNGLVGCLAMQPKLFGEVPVNFEFPCFDLNSDEIKIIESPKKQPQKEEDSDDSEDEEEKDETSTGTPSETDETLGGFKVEDIISVVSKTADQGIKIITELFGIGDDDEKKPAQAAESKAAPENKKNNTKSS
jgi:hypothetical protein